MALHAALRTFPDLLQSRLRSDPGQPLVTAYDEASGERTELSVTTFANWVSKTANLLTDEIGLDAGDTVLLDLPAHWLVPVFLGGAWTAGIAVTTDPGVAHDLVVRGPEPGPGAVGAVPVLCCALRPFATRYPEPLPGGLLDHGLVWPGQSDVFVPVEPAGPDTVAWRTADGVRAQADLLGEAEVSDLEDGARLLTDLHPAIGHGVPVLLSPLVHGGSVVLVSHPRDGDWPARHEDERATVVRRAAERS